MRTCESEPILSPMPSRMMLCAGRKPSPRFPSVVGHAHTLEPRSASSPSSRSSAWVAWTTVVRRPRNPVSARSSTGLIPCSSLHSSISRGCSSAWMWRGRSFRRAYSPILSSHARGTALTLCAATPTLTRARPFAHPRSVIHTFQKIVHSRVSEARRCRPWRRRRAATGAGCPPVRRPPLRLRRARWVPYGSPSGRWWT